MTNQVGVYSLESEAVSAPKKARIGKLSHYKMRMQEGKSGKEKYLHEWYYSAN